MSYGLHHARHAATAIFESLSDSTKRLCKPLLLREDDRLRITLAGDGSEFLVEAFSNVQHFYPSPSAYSWWKDLPEWKHVPGSSYAAILKTTDLNALVINTLWDQDRIEFADRDTSTIFLGLLLRFQQQIRNTKLRADFKETGVLPPEPEGWVEHPTFPLVPYQKASLWTSIGTEAFAYFMEQGTGKTPVLVNRVNYEGSRKYRKQGELYRTLVVCPKNVRNNWENEFMRFSTSCGRVTILKGGALQRLARLVEAMNKSDPEVEWTTVVCGYETATRALNILLTIPWDLIICDESHMFKEHSTKRAKTMKILSTRAASRAIMTGTPIANSPRDLYTQLEFLAEGMSGFSSFTAFRKFYEKYDTGGDGIETVSGFQNLPFMKERLARVGYMISKRDAMPDLPEKRYDMIEVEMTPEQRQAYNDMLERLTLEIEETLNAAEAAGSNKSITANIILTQLLRLTQFTSGFKKYDDTLDMFGNIVERGAIEYFSPNPKAEAIRDAIAAHPVGEKAIVWATFTADIHAIKREMDAIGVRSVVFAGGTNDKDRTEAERAFNCDPDCRVFIGNAAAGGTGLNLRGYNPDDPESHTNCTRVFYYSQNWSMVQRSQSEDRAHRKGTRMSVLYTDLVVPGTIDEEIRRRVVSKREDAASIQDIRDIIKLIQQVAVEGVSDE